MTVHMTFNDTKEYSLKSIAILGCNIYSEITVAHVTLPKAVLSTVKIFAVYLLDIQSSSLVICFVVIVLQKVQLFMHPTNEWGRL